MIGGFLTGIATSPWLRAALRYGAIALAVLLLMLSLRRSGERAGRLAERLETTEKANDVQRRMLEPRLAALVIAMSWLNGCATDASDVGSPGACPSVVEYSPEFHALAAEELAVLPEGSAIVEMMADYAAMREQVGV